MPKNMPNLQHILKYTCAMCFRPHALIFKIEPNKWWISNKLKSKMTPIFSSTSNEKKFLWDYVFYVAVIVIKAE